MNKFLYIASSFNHHSKGLRFQFLNNSFRYTCPILGINSSYRRDVESDFIKNHFEKTLYTNKDFMVIKFIYED